MPNAASGSGKRGQGGFPDQLELSPGDAFGNRPQPGTRIPALVISPFAKKGHVDHTQYDSTSVLRTIEVRFGLKPLAERDLAAQPMLGAFDFTR